MQKQHYMYDLVNQLRQTDIKVERRTSVVKPAPKPQSDKPLDASLAEDMATCLRTLIPIPLQKEKPLLTMEQSLGQKGYFFERYGYGKDNGAGCIINKQINGEWVYTGRSLVWKNMAYITDPFPTKKEAIAAAEAHYFKALSNRHRQESD